MKYENFKVKCVGYTNEEYTGKRSFDIGKVYEVKKGVIYGEHNRKFDAWSNPWFEGRDSSFASLCKWFKWFKFELVPNEVNSKIVITTDGKTTTATKYYPDGRKVTGTAKCNPADEFDFNTGANIAMERMMDAETPKHYVGKVVCVSNEFPVSGGDGVLFYPNSEFTPGKVYEVTEDTIISDEGEISIPRNVKKISEYIGHTFIPFVE